MLIQNANSISLTPGKVVSLPDQVVFSDYKYAMRVEYM